jgi:SSS family solute:Na+ symporter
MTLNAELIFAIVALTLIHVVGAKRAASEGDFFVAGRSAGSFSLGLSVASGIVGGGVLLVYCEYIYRFGWSALWILAGLIIGLILLDPVARRLKPIADRHDCVSLPDLVVATAGKTAGYCASVVVLIWTGAFIVMQLISGGLLLNVLMGLRYEYGVILGGIIVLTYLLRGGMQSVVRTDILQYAILALLFFVATLPATTAVTTQHLDLPSLDVGTAAGFLILGALNVLVSADLWMRLYAAPSVREARKSLIYGSVFTVILTLLATAPAFYAVSVGVKAPPNEAFIAALRLLLPRILFGLAIAGTICIVLAALDTMIFVFGVAGANDIGVRAGLIDPSARRRWTQVGMVIAFIIGVTLSLFFRQLLAVGLALSSVGLALVPITAALLWRARKQLTGELTISSKAAVGSLISGTVAVLAIPAFTRLTPETALVSLPASIVGWLIGWLLDRVTKNTPTRVGA